MKTLYTLLLAFGLLFINIENTEAQGSLGLYTTSVSDNTPAMGDQLSLFTKLINVSPTDTFTGVVDFGLAHNGGEITDLAIFGKPAIAGTTVITLNPLEEKSLLFTVEIQPAYFSPGSDIIIVWPIATANIVDSARASIYINAATGINNVSNNTAQLFVSNNRLFIINAAEKYPLERLRIIDLQGRVINTFALTGTSFNTALDELSHGIYLAEVTTKGGACKVLKFVY